MQVTGISEKNDIIFVCQYLELERAPKMKAIISRA